MDSVKNELPKGYQRLVEVLGEGKENSKTTKQIIKEMNMPGNDVRNVRHIVEQLIKKHGYLIGSSRKGNKGYYLITSHDEFKETIQTYNSQVQSMLDRLRKLQDNYIKRDQLDFDM